MLNVRTKFALISFIVFITVSCTKSKKEIYNIEAENLYVQADSCMNNKNYTEALLLIDSINNAYPKAIEIRKKAKLLRPLVMEQFSAQQLSITDSLLAVSNYIGDSLKAYISNVKNPIENYFINKQLVGTNVQISQGLYLLISPDLHYYIVVSGGGKTPSNRVELRSNGNSIYSDVVEFDGERNTNSSCGRSITFTESQSKPLADFIMANKANAVTVVFHSDSGKSAQFTLSDKLLRNFVETYSYIEAVRQNRVLNLEKERLQKQLALSRQQIANAVD